MGRKTRLLKMAQAKAIIWPGPAYVFQVLKFGIEGKMKYNIFFQKVVIKLFCKSQFSHRSVNLFFISVTIKDKLADLCGNQLLKNDVINTFCEIEPPGKHPSVPRQDAGST